LKKLIVLCCFLPVLGFAQKNEISFTAGAVRTSGQSGSVTASAPCVSLFPKCNVTTVSQSTNTAFAFEFSYARRMLSAGPAALFLELPMLEAPGHNVTTLFTSPIALPSGASSNLFFLTPSAKLKFFSSGPISPWASLGGGLGHLALGGNTRNNAALQFGGGLDFRTPLPHLRARVEARDFWSGGVLQPDTFFAAGGSSTLTHNQHHVLFGAGAVLAF
jgi:hypothetical protein